MHEAFRVTGTVDELLSTGEADMELVKTLVERVSGFEADGLVFETRGSGSIVGGGRASPDGEDFGFRIEKEVRTDGDVLVQVEIEVLE